jgi:pyruvate, orthophosphate dikinase
MQARAIFEAAAEVQKEGIEARPEVMIPLVGFPKELTLQINIVHRVAAEVAQEKETRFNYLVGTMIEIPRAALVADKIAEGAQFFSFGISGPSKLSKLPASKSVRASASLDLTMFQPKLNRP